MVRLALYHCCPVSCSLKVCSYLFVAMWCAFCDHSFLKMEQKCQFKLNVDRVFSAESLDLQKTLIEKKKKTSPMSFYNMAACCRVRAWCFNPVVYCLCYCLNFVTCISKCKSLKDYFGYVHACDMFRMLISTKKKLSSLKRKSRLFFFCFTHNVERVYFKPRRRHGCVLFRELN